MKRASLNLASKDILRGTTSFVLLENFGKRLRDTNGQVSITVAEDEYQASFPVDRLDNFLSHSWHAWWVLKYVSLLLYFNGPAAVMVTLFFCLCVTPVFKNLVYSMAFFEGTTLRDWVVNEKGGMYRDPGEVQFCSLYVGLIVFPITLFSWHYIRKLIRTSLMLGTQSIFLDKVCIHQTNAELKALGIQSIGAILDNCDGMILAWDASYFERLWCTFEIAAFKFRQDRHVIFLPIMVGKVVAFLGFSLWCCEIARNVVIEVALKYDGPRINMLGFEMLYYVPFTCLQTIFVNSARAYARDIELMSKQIKHFSVRHAKCFCCDNNHINPSSGAAMPCDREIVFASIAHWHGGDNLDVGLKHFDALVRADLGQEVEEMLPGWAHLRYSWAVAACLPCVLPYIDLFDFDYRIVLWRLMRDLLLVAPGMIGLTMAVSMEFPEQPPLDASYSPLTTRVLHFVRQWSITVAIAWLPTIGMQSYYHFLPQGYVFFYIFGYYPMCVRRVFFLLFWIILDVKLYTNWSLRRQPAQDARDEAEGLSFSPRSFASMSPRSFASKSPRSMDQYRRPSTESVVSRRSSGSTGSRESAPKPLPPSKPSKRLTLGSLSSKTTAATRSSLQILLGNEHPLPLGKGVRPSSTSPELSLAA